MSQRASSQISPGTKILVTGAEGFIGRHLCRQLMASGVELHGTSRQERPFVPSEPIWWQADIADLVATRRVFSSVKPDIVFHLAGRTGARPDCNQVLPTYHSLATSTVNVLVLASEHACRRVILFGSCNEPTLGNVTPASPYAAAKWIGSAYGRMFYALYGTPVVNLRPFMTYGPAQARDKLIPSVALSLINRECPQLTSGRAQGDWIYIDDVVGACIAAIGTPGIEGETFDLGTGCLTSHRELVEKIVVLMKSDIVPQFGALPDRSQEQLAIADTRPAFQRLGWRATTSLEDGLLGTLAWYKENWDSGPASR
jgi:UDP-glucose 4-epimerase